MNHSQCDYKTNINKKCKQREGLHSVSQYIMINALPYEYAILFGWQLYCELNFIVSFHFIAIGICMIHTY